MTPEDRGRSLAVKLRMNPRLIVKSFLAALEHANQRDLYRVVSSEWNRLLEDRVSMASAEDPQALNGNR